MNLPSFETYCPNTTAANALVFDLGDGFRVWFSYKTPVAFQHPADRKPMVRQNEWGPTTGKHLNAIDGADKANRWPERIFRMVLDEALSGSGRYAPDILAQRAETEKAREVSA